ncbi:MAG: hypothetical protein FWE52_00165 [Alphaproteobacteria bacterium]|nr:hypothetical protein [Alphaproteobacteria bacterium]
MPNFDFFQTFFMLAGFSLAMYSCVANDVPQTLGTFLSSNMKRPRFTIWAFTITIFIATITIGYFFNAGDMAFGRLDQIPMAAKLYWWHLIPPIVLLTLTRFGIPVSTTFLLLSVFSSTAVIGAMVMKSLAGYIIAFASAMFAYTVISRKIEKKWILTAHLAPPRRWIIAQWISTAFLWSSWLMQNSANLVVYFPRDVSIWKLLLVIVAMSGFMWLIITKRGGRIQKIVMRKTSVTDVRSATIINFIYGIILFLFLKYSTVPMSTTWVFIGLLAGREIALRYRLDIDNKPQMWRDIIRDFLKISLGLLVSIGVAYMIVYLSGV